jgi:hypothetical protein
LATGIFLRRFNTIKSGPIQDGNERERKGTVLQEDGPQIIDEKKAVI